jgi:hypothetical protein
VGTKPRRKFAACVFAYSSHFPQKLETSGKQGVVEQETESGIKGFLDSLSENFIAGF